MRDFLFEDIRVSGRGDWTKSTDGRWSIDDFVITDFMPVVKESLRDTVDRIRVIGVSWPEDLIGEVRRVEERNGTGS